MGMIIMSLLVFLIAYAATLEGSIDGIKMYLGGTRLEPLDPSDELTILTDTPYYLDSKEMWIDAMCQVFFSLGTCMGIFAVMGSYRKPDRRVIARAIAVSLFDTLFAFFSGFVVWSILGFLNANGGLDGLRADEIENTEALIFVAIPNALDMVVGGNWWTFVVMLMFVLLGITTTISFTEVVTCTINDVAYLRKIPR
jgi:SNF family Na+-dependent transporter